MVSTEKKIELRHRAMAARAELRGHARHEATTKAANRAYDRLAGTTGLVGLYEAFRDEIHPGEVAQRLHENGRRLALPSTPKFGQPLVFRAWAPGDPLIRGRLNIPEPSPDAPEVFPQVLLVPPVAFDRRGYRIGYGAGFYDRTIPRLREMHRVFALGYAFACQEFPDLPTEHHDIPLDAIATEHEIIAVQSPLTGH